MSKKMLIDATHPEETRVVVVDGTKVEEFDFETVNKRQIAGNIYLAKVTRVEPSLQAAFVDYGGNRHGFLAFAEIHPDYYQIPAADRQALLEEEKAANEDEEQVESRPPQRRRRSASRAEKAHPDEIVKSESIPGMATIGPDDAADDSHIVDVPDAGPSNDSGDDSATGNGEGSAADAGDEVRAEGASDDGADSGDSDDGETDNGDSDDSIESLSGDDSQDIRPAKKYRPRRYKIQEVVKVRQIMLVQVVKEERGNKGAALTTYLSLAGRYCVLMPNTARGGGISRKITSAADRKKLKDIASELQVPQGAGLIIRTAGSQRTRTEIRRDYEYLMRLWEQIRELTFKSVAPAPIYEEGDLIKRQIRDLYSRDIDEILVEGERGYRTARDFMKMIMPSHVKNVKHHVDPMPLYARYQVESYLAGMFNPVVQLKSGGYIVIGVTEALVAIDVNSGRATKEGSIEDTAYKTNCEAADEIARQLRLRDLAGLIVIDFIDMEERKNNAAVEKRFKERLKTDRARIQVGRISGFGLMEMSRQRLRPGMLESTTQPCPHCHGTGLIRSDDSLALTILRAIEEEGTRRRSREVLVKAPIAVVNYLMNSKREHIAGIEARYAMSVRVEADATLISPDFALEKFKTATRVLPEATANVVSVDARLMAQIDDEDHQDEEPDGDEAAEDSAAGGDGASGEEGNGATRRRRRRRRRNGHNGDSAEGNGAENGAGESEDQAVSEPAEAPVGDEPAEVEPAKVEAVTDGDGTGGERAGTSPDSPAAEAAPPRRTRSRTRRRRGGDEAESTELVAAEGAAETSAQEEAADRPLPAHVALPEPVDLTDMPLAPVVEPAEPVAAEQPEEQPETSEPAPSAEQDAPADEAQPMPATLETPADVPVPEAAEMERAAAPQPAPVAEEAEEETARPKRRGWWSVG